MAVGTKTKFAVALISATAIGMVVWTSCFRKQLTLEELARLGVEWVNKGDADSIFEWLTKEEKKIASVTKENLQNFLQEFGPTQKKNYQPDGTPQITVFQRQGVVSASQFFRTPSNLRSGISIFTIQTDDGPKILAVTESILKSYLIEINHRQSEAPEGAKKFQLWIDELTAHMPRLEATGLPGICKRQGTDLELVFNSWKGQIEYYQFVINRINAEAKSKEN